ncbi:ATP-dependent helicase [Methanobrevibacter millerae]|uniref:DNA 3'-5' helicase n=1 Tax=Methanobrevibacter millerae TaxID=230361 RepID=A0A0U3EJI9_9EURY|nr:ATP-dependent helicase [Methanobrevibacter millerae]ALT68733.1 ATP-dependent DNA helicase UvrD/REP family [Methanobrevibacter millerae]
MISYEEFEDIVVNILKRDISSNHDQQEAILSKANEGLFIVAGPGSGKTTVIVLKILKYIFVDDIKPNEILATTFTKKAADELYSRILGWGDEIKNYLIDNAGDDFDLLIAINRIDFNQLTIGTTDSIAQELLRVHKEPGTNQEVVIEEFVAKFAMVKILLKDNRYLDENLQGYLKSFTTKDKLKEASQMSEILLQFKNRMYFDQIDFDEFYANVGEGGGARIALDCIKEYEEELKSRNIIDFTMLESKFLDSLRSGKMDIFLDDLKIILIDEYQDTNLIQEEIYFTMAQSAIANGGSISVVGDDDQSLYRFRGATVDLFTNFKSRVREKLGIDVREINLRTNYRSSRNIINHCNQFVELDGEYQHARVEDKPKIIAPDLEKYNMPILGLFRNNLQMLSKDLAKLVSDLINNGETTLKVNRVIDDEYFKRLERCRTPEELKQLKKDSAEKAKDIDNISIKLDEEEGSASDMALLTFSPKEMKSGTHTLNGHLRNQLKRLRKPIEVFNPRGRDLQEIKEVAIFCGLMLECIDPESKIQNSDKQIPNLGKRNMQRWRYEAREYIKLNPEPHNPFDLNTFIIDWQRRNPRGYEKWPNRANLMELAYKLVTWLDFLQEDAEGVVYLEAITQSITQTGFFNKYSANIMFTSPEEEKASILEAIWNIFLPIATGDVAIDEALLETLPSNRLNIMSIHQSKGLEFPMVIVDVGSKFKNNDVRTQNLRFPKKEPGYTVMEESIRKYSELGEDERSEKDKSFDDLTRLYFVAFSRAEHILILVGLNKAIDGYSYKQKHKSIPNVALGWSRDEHQKGFKEIYLI